MTQQETVAANRRNYGALPKATAVSIQYVGNKGKFTDGQYTACSFMVMVNVKGVWKPEGAWLHDAGMKTENRRGVYTTIQKAKEAKERILTRWGVATSKSGKAKDEAVAKAKEEVIDNMRKAMLNMGLKSDMVDIIMANLNK
jgi:hypothetical protein